MTRRTRSEQGSVSALVAVVATGLVMVAGLAGAVKERGGLLHANTAHIAD